MNNRNRPALERFAEKTEESPSGCIEWTAFRNASGYGKFKPGTGMNMVFAHRWSYEHHVGPIPEGLVIDHLCGNRSCVNHTHLEPVTQQTNVRRGNGNCKRTHCPQGHPYTGDNLYVSPRGFRYCRECNRSRARLNHSNKKAGT